MKRLKGFAELIFIFKGTVQRVSRKKCRKLFQDNRNW